jgi:26S proteasome regulatory subunit N12
LYLLTLLSSNRIGDFHTELELIPGEFLDNKYVNYAVQLEQELMEGSYNQLWNASAHVPSPVYLQFVNTMVGAVRERILECCEKSYLSLSVSDASQLLNIKNADEAVQFAVEHGWEIRGNQLFFKKEQTDALEIPAHKVVSQVLSYATELERIV